MMNRLFSLLLAALLQLAPMHAKADELNEIRLVSEEWEQFTLSDGTGLYWDIFRYVYEPDGIKVSALTVPYDTAANSVRRGQADAWVASYLNENDFLLYPTWHFDIDIVSAAFNEDKLADFKGIRSLANKKVAWIRGYDLRKYRCTFYKI